MATIKEIAEIAEVSTTTVSNVIHGNLNKVSPQNVEKIRKIIDDIGYIPQNGHRIPSNTCSKIIAVIINSHRRYENSVIDGTTYSEVISSIERKIRHLGYFMMLYLTEDIDDVHKLVIDFDIDGVIAITFDRNDCEKLSRTIKKPMISIDGYGKTNQNPSVPNVGEEHSMGGYIMVEHLLNSGYENIFVCASRDYGIEHMRWIGAKNAFEKLNKNKDAGIKFLTLGRTLSSREKQYQQLASQVPFKQKSAVFFLSDLFALEALSLFADRGINVPEDLAVAGFDDISYSRISVPKLTTVHQDANKKAEYAVDELVKKIENNSYNIQLEYSFPVYLVARQSV